MSTKKNHIVLCSVISLVLLLMNVPCSAWIFDGGPESKLSIPIKDDSIPVWIAATFTVANDSYATKFGLALSRANAATSFNIYLTDNLSDLPGSAITSWTLSPTTATPTYTYYQPATPIYLKAKTGYALIITPASDDSYGAAAYSTIGYYGLGTADYGESWYRLTYPLCVRVDGYAVPEPAVLCFLLSGIGTLALRRRVRPSV